MSKILEKILSYLCDALIYGLMLSIMFVVFVSALITLPGIRELFSHEYSSAEFVRTANSDGLKYLSSFVVSSAALVALLTYLREKKRIGRELEERRSRFFFEQATVGLDEVYNLLKNQNNDRITWLRAARDLLHSINLSKQITTTEYKEAYCLVEEKIRYKLYIALTVYDEKTKERNALPPQFFYGLRDWQVERSLNEAAQLASKKIIVHNVSIDKVLRPSTPLSLAKNSVVTIYDFLEYPKGYKDPLDSVTIWGGHWGDYGSVAGLGIDQGARKFVCHISQHLAIDGNLQRIKKPADGEEP